MSTQVSMHEQSFQVFDGLLENVLEIIVKYTNDRSEEEVTIEDLRGAINQPTGKTVSLSVASTVKVTKEIPPESQCCKPITGKSTRDICGKQISREGGIFCAACRKLKTLNMIAKDVMAERGMTLWEATAGCQGVEPSKKAKRYEESEDEDEDDDDAEEDNDEEEVEQPKRGARKVIKKTPPNSRLTEAAKKKRVVRK